MFDDHEQHDDSPTFHGELLDRCASLELRLREVEAELEHSHRLAMLGTIVGSIAHEINNILTPVVSYAELAKMHPEDAALSAKALDRAAAGASQAASIATSILDLIRVPSSDGEAPTAFVEAAVEHALLCTGHREGKESVSICVEVESECAAAIEPVALQQVLLNLLLNASRAMARGGGETSVVSSDRLVVRGSTWNTSAGESRVRIDVEDTGCGMDEVMLGQIFEPFVSRGGACPQGPSGTGLGLSTSRQLIERFGGTIGATSRVGVGTVFTIDLPAIAAEHARKSA